jgi:glutamate-1-semialdehyde 2,1-aminomutase
VVEAAYRAMQSGINFTRPSPIEIELAEKMVELIDSAEMVKFAKNGSDVTTAAVKLARAYTNRDLIAICADHPFFSVDDWFIGATEMSAGIPKAIRDLTVQFHYNDIESVQALFSQYPGQIACLVMEVERLEPPVNNFLQDVRRLCTKNGALLIFDEIITGFRWHLGGAQKLFDIIPDLSTFGKAMGNGFSISALVGKKDIMELGGLRTDKERVFLLSTTYGAETHSLAAALETIKIYERENDVEHLYRQGEELIAGIHDAEVEHDLEGYFGTLSRPCNLIFFTRDRDKQPSQPLRTLFLQETLKRGVILPSLVVSYSHTDEDIDRTIEAIAESLGVYRNALENGVEPYLKGRSVQPAVRKYN